MVFSLRAFLIAPLCLAFAPFCAMADEAIITKARAYLGAEADLTTVRALLFKGGISVVEGKYAPAITAKLEIAFKHPDRQLITAFAPDKIETTGLDGYEAWQREEFTADKTRNNMILLGREQIKRLRANVFEVLSFGRGIECVGGKIEERGTAVVDGVQCVKLAFIHAPNVVFVRYYDGATGRLVLTETDKGSQIREQGELRAGNLRFPRQTITTTTLPDGSTRTVTITYTEIMVNPELPDTLFAIPSVAP